MRSIVPVVFVVAILFFHGEAFGSEPACMVFTQEQAKQIAENGGSKCTIKCEGCGCKGGPGYRTGRGQCVSYQNLIGECSTAHHERCRAECRPVVSGCERPLLLN